jgi:hypothetical protein
MLGLPEFPGNRYLSVASLSALCTVRLYPEELFLVLFSVSGLVDSRTIVWPEELNQREIQMTTSRIETATFRLLAPPRTTLRDIYKITNLSPPIHNGVHSVVLSLSVAEFLESKCAVRHKFYSLDVDK